jgi:hypothetical protein
VLGACVPVGKTGAPGVLPEHAEAARPAAQSSATKNLRSVNMLPTTLTRPAPQTGGQAHETRLRDWAARLQALLRARSLLCAQRAQDRR